jgi:hypothetical protein
MAKGRIFALDPTAEPAAVLTHHIGQDSETLHVEARGTAADQLDMIDIASRYPLQHSL